jgi:large subunit ribosomal protein L5e
MDKLYTPNQKINGEDFNIEPHSERRPFKAILDIGLARTTIGARIFGCLKGATDGGIFVPHSENKFPGYSIDEESREGNYDPEFHRKKIFGANI